VILAAKTTSIRAPRGRPRKINARLAVAYIRVSTEEQKNGPEAQRDAIERYVAAHGLELVVIVEDVGTSGGAPLEERPKLWEAIEAAKAKRAAVLLVAKRDRLARDTFAALLVERNLEAAGIRLESADGAGNGSSPEAALLRSMLDAIAQYERAMIRLRTKSALAARKRRGLRGPGSIPFGKRLATDGQTLEDDPAETAIVARIVAERKAGRTFQAIADGLEADRAQARGGRWHLTTIQRIARRT
jgi:DNA invertase Pin-like site-specific DNA recombinase